MTESDAGSVRVRTQGDNEECPGNTDAGAIMKKFIYKPLINYSICLYNNNKMWIDYEQILKLL